MIWRFKEKQPSKSANLKIESDLSTQSFDLLRAIDAESIVVATLSRLASTGKIPTSTVQSAIEKYALHDVSAADPGNTEGSG